MNKIVDRIVLSSIQYRNCCGSAIYMKEIQLNGDLLMEILTPPIGEIPKEFILDLSLPEVITLEIDYTNHRDEREIRKIQPCRRGLWFGTTRWHPEPQWFLLAFCLEKQGQRDFAVKDIHSWKKS